MRRDLSPFAAAQGSLAEQPQAAAQGATLQGGVGSGATAVILQSPATLSRKIEKKTNWPGSGRRPSASDADAIATRQQALVGGLYRALLKPLSAHSDLAASHSHLCCHSCDVACQFAPVVEGVDSGATAGN